MRHWKQSTFFLMSTGRKKTFNPLTNILCLNTNIRNLFPSVQIKYLSLCASSLWEYLQHMENAVVVLGRGFSWMARLKLKFPVFLVSVWTKRPITREQTTMVQVSGGQGILMGGWVRKSMGEAWRLNTGGRLRDPGGAEHRPRNLRHLLATSDWWGRADEPSSQCQSPIK